MNGKVNASVRACGQSCFGFDRDTYGFACLFVCFSCFFLIFTLSISTSGPNFWPSSTPSWLYEHVVHSMYRGSNIFVYTPRLNAYLRLWKVYPCSCPKLISQCIRLIMSQTTIPLLHQQIVVKLSMRSYNVFTNHDKSMTYTNVHKWRSKAVMNSISWQITVVATDNVSNWARVGSVVNASVNTTGPNVAVSQTLCYQPKYKVFDMFAGLGRRDAVCFTYILATDI